MNRIKWKKYISPYRPYNYDGYIGNRRFFSINHSICSKEHPYVLHITLPSEYGRESKEHGFRELRDAEDRAEQILTGWLEATGLKFKEDK